MKYKVAITTKTYYLDESIHILKQANAELLLRICKTEDEVIHQTKDMDAIMTTLAPFPGRVIESLTKCKVIVRVGVGVDNLDLEAATRKGIYVVNVPDFYVDDVANHTIALILACSRRIVQIDAATKRGSWTLDEFPLFGLHSQTVGLIGFGGIAKAVVSRLKPFGPKIIVYHPRVSRGIVEEAGCGLVELGALIQESDFISLHCPLTKETNKMIGEKELKEMKRNAYLINTSRAGIVDQKALFKALKEEWIAGAGLDVFEKEPPEPSNPLLSLANLISSPHIGWYAEDTRSEAAKKGAQEIVRILNGERPLNIVNTEILQ
jgi:D-3-phosphoglycerate dehydrogenase